jgi:hypothetical protein
MCQKERRPSLWLAPDPPKLSAFKHSQHSLAYPARAGHDLTGAGVVDETVLHAAGSATVLLHLARPRVKDFPDHP